MLHEDETVLRDDDVRVQRRLGIERLLDALHECIGFLAPFELDEWRHVAARAMLGLQRAVEVRRNEVADVLDKFLVLRLALVRLEILRDDEMDVAVEDVAVDDAIAIAVVVHALAERHDAIREVVTREGDILDDDGRADRAHATDGREDARANLPVEAIDIRVFRELDRIKDFVLADDFLRLRDALFERLMVVGARLDQDGRCAIWQRADDFGNAVPVLDGFQRDAVEELACCDERTREVMHGAARFAQAREEDERRRLVFRLDDRAVRDFGDERERALRADDDVLQDVDGVVEINERIEAVARRVLDLVLVCDEFLELRISRNLVVDGHELFHDALVRLAPRPDARIIRGIEHRAVCKDELQVEDGLVAVVRCAAAHAARIVRGHAANHRVLDGCGVRADLALVRREVRIGHRADDARLERDFRAAIVDVVVLPALRRHDEHGIRERLAAETRASCAERHGDVALAGLLHEEADLVNAARLHDDLRRDAVEARVDAVRIAAHGIDDDAVGGDALADGMEIFLIFRLQRFEVLGTVL